MHVCSVRILGIRISLHPSIAAGNNRSPVFPYLGGLDSSTGIGMVERHGGLPLAHRCRTINLQSSLGNYDNHHSITLDW